MADSILTADRLRDLFFYDPDVGKFIGKRGVQGRIAGSVAGYVESRGYVKIKIDGVEYRAHRLAWLYVYGEFPSMDLDHINWDKSDNRIENLRMVTRCENQQNSPIRKDNTSGYKGVTFNKSRGKWAAVIVHKGVAKKLGNFGSAEDAGLAYSIAAASIHTHNPFAARA